MSKNYAHIEIKKDVHKQLKLYCAKNNKTIKEVIEELINKELHKVDKKQKGENNNESC